MDKLFLFLFFLPGVALAQLGPLFGVNPQTMGMGSVSLVQGQASPYQVFSAPAALGFLRSVEVGAGGLYFDPKLKPFGTLVLNSNGTRGNFNGAGVLGGGGSLAALALPLGKTRPLTLGVVAFMPFSTLVRVSSSPVNYPFYPLYSDISRNFFFVLGAGYEIIDGLALGVNVRSTTKSSTYYELRKDSSVNYSASATEAKGDSRLSFSVVYDHGRRNRERPFSVGAMYRAPAGLQTKIAADVSMFVPIQGEVVSLPAYSPSEWVLMGSARWRRFTFGLDLAWVEWSKYISPYGTGNINTYAFGTPQKAGFKNIPVGRWGVEYGRPREGWIKKISYRLGYLYHPSPVPDQTGDSNFVDSTRHMTSAGIGLGWENPWREGDLLELDIFAQANWLQSRSVRKSSPTFVGAPGYETGGQIWLYGAGVRMKF